MPIYQTTLRKRQEVARLTYLFEFDKPAGFDFIPGQYAGFTLINPSERDESGITRRFSIASIPEDHHLSIVTRIQNSAFKRELLKLSPQDSIKLAGPSGNFVLPPTSEPVIFIAGGMGIAPFFSMIKSEVAKNSHRPMTLFYGNQEQQDAAFLSELKDFATRKNNFKLVLALSQPNPDWQAEKGYITETMIRKYVSDLTLPIYYVCGGPVMVSNLQETLLEMNINPQQIRTEDFPGY